MMSDPLSAEIASNFAEGRNHEIAGPPARRGILGVVDALDRRPLLFHWGDNELLVRRWV